MGLRCTSEGKSPPFFALSCVVIATELSLVVCALSPPRAFAAQNESEPGVVYVQHRFDSGSGIMCSVKYF